MPRHMLRAVLVCLSMSVGVHADLITAENVIAGVPRYLWRHGCGPTAAGMVIGYYDTHGFGALFPGDGSTQTSAVNEAIASTEHYNDYCLPMDVQTSPDDPLVVLPDKSEPPTGDEHPNNCLADFAKTSWSSRGMAYGYGYNTDLTTGMAYYVDYVNSQHGTEYYAESWFKLCDLDFPSLTFSWRDFKTEIDANHPMGFTVDSTGNGTADHFVTAVGYRVRDGIQEYACRDTWASTPDLRWQRFWDLGPEQPWGIHSAIYFSIIPEPSTALMLLMFILPVVRRLPSSP